MGEMTFRTTVHGLSRTTTVRDAARKMSEEDVGSVLIFDGEKPVGIFTERDLARRVIATGLDPETTPLEDVMSTDIQTINAHTPIDEALKLMKSGKIRHLPVARDGDIVGIVSMSDLGHIAGEESRTLFAYITGGYPG